MEQQCAAPLHTVGSKHLRPLQAAAVQRGMASTASTCWRWQVCTLSMRAPSPVYDAQVRLRARHQHHVVRPQVAVQEAVTPSHMLARFSLKLVRSLQGVHCLAHHLEKPAPRVRRTQHMQRAYLSAHIDCRWRDPEACHPTAPLPPTCEHTTTQSKNPHPLKPLTHCPASLAWGSAPLCGS